MNVYAQIFTRGIQLALLLQCCSPHSAASNIEDMIASPEGQQRLQQFQQVMDGQNSTPIDYFGKVVDQNGNPVIGATVTGNILLNSALESTRYESHSTVTDANGQFQFTGFHGVNIGVSIGKSGYEIGDHGEGFKGPANGPQSTANDLAVFNMWKLAGAEPMGHQMFHFLIPCDGTATHINLTAGKIVVTGGDLVVAFVRDPIQIVRGTPFKWTLTLSVPEGGGMIEAQDTYHYVAPESGYQPAITITADPAKMSDSNSYTKTYYFKSAAGKFYARIGLRLQADFQPPPTFFQIDAYINPSGSKNLEFDPAKTIKPK